MVVILLRNLGGFLVKMSKKQKFLRTDSHKYSKLGVRRKNKQKYRKAKGRDNKIRLKMKGHLRNVSIGFRSEKKNRDLIKGLKPIRVSNIEDLKNIKQGEIVIVSKVGDKKRKEILNYATEHNIKLNLNIKKSLEKIEDELKKRKQEKKKKEEKRIEQDKKAKKAAEKKAKEAEKEAKTESKKEEEEKESIENEIEEKEVEKKQEIETKESVKHETDVKENVEGKK